MLKANDWFIEFFLANSKDVGSKSFFIYTKGAYLFLDFYYYVMGVHEIHIQHKNKLLVDFCHTLLINK